MIIFQLATSYLTPTYAMSSFSFHVKDSSCGHWKDVSLFEKGQILGLHQAEKTSKETVETTKMVFEEEM